MAILVDFADSDERNDEKAFSNKLKLLSSETGKILNDILKDLSFDPNKERSLTLALDDQTVEIPWELAYLPKDPRIAYRKMLCEKLGVERLRVVKAEQWFDPPIVEEQTKLLL